MSVRPKLTSFMVYNPTYGPKEGQEHLKVIYYYPESEDPDIKVNNVGLCEALVQFTKTYSPEKPCESIHTQKHRQVFYEAETDFWLVMTVANPYIVSSRDGQSVKDYQEEDLKDIVLRAVLKKAYSMFKLFMGTFGSILTKEDVEILKTKLKEFYSKYIPDIEIHRSDILDVHNGIEFFPMNKSNYLTTQSFLNLIESTFPQIKYTMMLYGNKVIWSGLQHDDSRCVYSYVVSKLLPTSSDFETSTVSSYLTRDNSYGRFLSGVRYYEHSTSRHMTPVYVDGASNESLFMIAYQVLNITVCLFIEGESPSVDTFRKLDSAMGKTLIGFATEIENSTARTIDNVDPLFKYVYFNRASLSFYSSCHSRDQQGKVKCTMPSDVMRVILNLCNDFSRKNKDMEVITKASMDYWVFGKRTEQHECYIFVNQKNANLIEVNEEVKKICTSHISAVTLSE